MLAPDALRKLPRITSGYLKSSPAEPRSPKTETNAHTFVIWEIIFKGHIRIGMMTVYVFDLSSQPDRESRSDARALRLLFFLTPKGGTSSRARHGASDVGARPSPRVPPRRGRGRHRLPEDRQRHHPGHAPYRRESLSRSQSRWIGPSSGAHRHGPSRVQHRHRPRRRRAGVQDGRESLDDDIVPDGALPFFHHRRRQRRHPQTPVELALACDVLLASPRASFRDTHAAFASCRAGS